VRLSFIIISYGRPQLLLRCLESLEPVEAPDVEILVVFNGRQEAPGRSGKPPAFTGAQVRILELPGRISRGAARNAAVAQARGDILYFLDDDVVAPLGLARRILDKFSRYPQVRAVGGPNLAAPGATPFQKAVDFLLRSTWGAGPMRVRYRTIGGDRLVPAWCFMLCNLGVRRSVFTRPGGLAFPDRCISAEENLLMHRLEKGSGPALLSDDLYVYHVRRGALAGFCRQVFQSGAGRAQITRMEPGSIQAVVFLPLLFAGYVLALGLGSWSWSAWLPLGGYGLVGLWEAVRLFRETRQAAAAGWLPVLMWFGHMSYAAGLLRGMIAPIVDNARPETMAP
jgi:GT2 family glycosyltransferase